MTGPDAGSPLAKLIGTLAFNLTRANYFMATAESCTGGMIAALCTDFPGSSEWFRGGVVAYADALKHNLLDVPSVAIEEHGAVSEAVVRHMALGALTRCAAQASVAVSGVAGPGGGTADKPVGTVWIAAAVMDVAGACSFEDMALFRELPGCSRGQSGGHDVVVHAMRHHFAGPRGMVRHRAAEAALRDLAALVEGVLGAP